MFSKIKSDSSNRFSSLPFFSFFRFFFRFFSKFFSPFYFLPLSLPFVMGCLSILLGEKTQKCLPKNPNFVARISVVFSFYSFFFSLLFSPQNDSLSLSCSFLLSLSLPPSLLFYIFVCLTFFSFHFQKPKLSLHYLSLCNSFFFI